MRSFVFPRLYLVWALLCVSLWYLPGLIAKATEQSIEAQTTAVSPAISASEQALIQQGQALIAAFAAELKTQLVSAIEQGGLPAGIGVCHQQAKIIADKFSQHGWRISRTSLKVRNQANVATAWQQKVLAQFNEQINQGQQVNTLLFSELDKQTFKMMQAIPTAPLCLSCHGKNIAQSVQNQLDSYYPDDNATGFSLGDMRGAFVVEKSLKAQ